MIVCAHRHVRDKSSSSSSLRSHFGLKVLSCSDSPTLLLRTVRMDLHGRGLAGSYFSTTNGGLPQILGSPGVVALPSLGRQGRLPSRPWCARDGRRLLAAQKCNGDHLAAWLTAANAPSGGKPKASWGHCKPSKMRAPTYSGKFSRHWWANFLNNPRPFL